MPRLSKPSGCVGCPLEHKGDGFAPADGPSNSWLLLVGESLGVVEAATGRPFMGDAGGMLQRLLNLLGWTRDSLRIHNVINCFPEQTIARAPGLRRAYRRRYDGVMATVATRQGTLTGTPNHPVLTTTGWIPLGDLQRGDYLIRPTGAEGVARGYPYVEDVPTPIAQMFETAANAGISRRVIDRAVNFHGDGRNGEVDVVTVNRMLGRDDQPSILQLLLEQLFHSTYPARSPDRATVTATARLLDTWRASSHRHMSGFRQPSSADSSFSLHPQAIRVGLRPPLDPQRFQRPPDAAVAAMEPPLDRVSGFTAEIELCEVTEVSFTGFSGHVYNLETTSQKYLADGFIVHNCHPPNDWFDERAPWYHGALNHCRYLDQSLSEGPQVVVPMGATAIKRVLGYTHHKGIRVQDFHGTVTRDPHDRFWIVPSFHPSHLQRGASNLTGTVLWDLLRAEEVYRSGWHPQESSIVVDPPIDWFRAWVDTVVAAREQDPAAYPISSDVETPDKADGRDEGEINSDDRSFEIIRQNVSCHCDEGVTVPYTGPYIEELKRLHQSPGLIWEWNRDYDFDRQVAAGQLTEHDSARVVDLMWLAHVLQTDVPRGLGFWAPFYSDYGAWKHLAAIDPGTYGGVDGLQTHRVGFGVTTDLLNQGQYAIAMRHTHDLYWKALRPAMLVGVQIDRQALLVFKADLIDKARRLLGELQTLVPETIAPLTPKGGMKAPPAADVLHVKASAFTRKGTPRKGKQPAEVKQELYQRARVVERVVLQEILTCQTCGAREIQRRHACPKPKRVKGEPPPEKPVPQIALAIASVTRWFWQEPFNPDSVPQVLAYMHHRKHKAGKAKKSASEESTNRETLERLERTTRDPFYKALLDYRSVVKIKGTYAEGTERRLDEHDRIHPKPTFKPSTLRLSYVDPNITNVVADKDEKRNLAAGFRKCVVASPGCQLLEVDYSGIEAVLTGYFARDPTYIRLAKIGIHAGLCSYIDGNPFDPSWPDDRLAAHILPYKTHEKYDPCKRFIHGKAYGLTRRGMMLQFPNLFPTEKVAAHYEQVFAQMAPKVAAWQEERQTKASKEHYLGGAGEHPFTYKHWFWSVFSYRRLTTTQYYRLAAKCKSLGVPVPVIDMNGQFFKVGPGPDHKRTLALFPQGTAAAILKEVILRLYDPVSPSYIGDAYYGQTPLRAPVHDSLLNEIPLPAWDWACERLFMEMQRPIPELPLPAEWGMGAYLSIGIAAKAGVNWMEMTKIAVPGYDAEWEPEPMEFEDADDWEDLKRVV